MKEKYPYKEMPVELNEMWFDLFGHTFTECFELAKVSGELGKLHQGHIRYILNTAAEQHPRITEFSLKT